MPASNRVFSLKNVTCQRRGKTLFQNLSIEMKDSDIIHLTGPNGSGKTSLLRVMAGALAPASGLIQWNGVNFSEDDHAARFSFLPSHDGYLKVLETCSENLAFWASLRLNAGKVSRALAAVGLENFEDTQVRYLSAGQKRRLGFARVLIEGAPLWLLDEPLNALDADGVSMVQKALRAHALAGGMAVVAGHHPVEDARILVMGASA